MALSASMVVRPGPVAIGPDDACLWTARPAGFDRAALAACLALLDAEERERHDRLHDREVRRHHLAARALVRCALSAHGGVPPAAWTFRRGPFGKPAIAAPGAGVPLCFNLSHTPGLVACLVARVEVGVDVERPGRRVRVMALARRHFAPAEVRDLRALPPAARTRRFLEFWTLKEAYLKARGLGLAGALDAISLAGSGEVRMAGDDPRRWTLGLVETTSGHVLAYAVRRPGVRLLVRPFAGP